MGEKTKSEILEATKERLNIIETELVMRDYVNGWLIKNYESEVILLKERISKLEE